MISWEAIAHLAYVNYGVQVDWDEGFFICPHCGEPIYECDWDLDDFFNGEDYICPVCEETID